MWRSAQLTVVVAGILLGSHLCAQQPSFDQPAPVPLEQTTPPTPGQPVTPGKLLQQQNQLQQEQSIAANPGLYHELDLLRRDGFSAAPSATVSLRVVDHAGDIPPGLEAPDFTLTVNGKQRPFKLHGPGSRASVVPAMVLLVFPPNDPVVHNIGVREAVKYFSAQPDEVLPWRVGIFDPNGKMMPFTNGRSQLLAYLDEVGQTKETFQYASEVTLSEDFRSQGPWLSKVEMAISTMQHYEGPKVILAMNPVDESFGLNDAMFEHASPQSLVPVAQHIGAHIYVGNVGGPDVIIPGGDSAVDLSHKKPSYYMQVDPSMNAALAQSAARTSLMMQTADATYGGFANSLTDLARQIHRDLDGGYSLDFDMTPEDQDHGVPDVAVRMTRHDLRVAILDVIPVGVSGDTQRAMNQDQISALFAKAAAKPVTSSEFRLTQRVDYFPLREGLEPVLPMSAIVEWTGHGRGPTLISVAERVEDPNLAHVILERELHVHWDGRSLAWERDGQLIPGHYLWSIAVHDSQGNIYAFSQKKIEVVFPRSGAMGVSSLILGKSCRDDSPLSGGLQHRPPRGAPQQPHLAVDPMRAGDCRIKPDTLGAFAPTDTMHAFVRIYPPEKFDKGKPESWTAKFTLRSPSGSIETEREIPFTLDSGSGYLASVQMPLSSTAITPGPHTLDVVMHGPGIHGNLKQSRPMTIESSP
jgi:hypothetical protein